LKYLDVELVAEFTTGPLQKSDIIFYTAGRKV